MRTTMMRKTMIVRPQLERTENTVTEALVVQQHLRLRRRLRL